ncbi:MAG: type II toxin-antitoxin system VapC family toxin [Actinomycetota bacterium]
MSVFVDTSAFYALMDRDDGQHQAAVDWLAGPGQDPAVELITHSYVVVESAALVHRGLGKTAVRVFFDEMIPAVSVVFVDQPLHSQAVAAYLAGSKDISLVDRTSFALMRQRSVRRAFGFDTHFLKEGFTTLP